MRGGIDRRHGAAPGGTGADAGGDMVKRHFDRELDHLKARLLHMGAAVEDLISRSIQALTDRDRKLAEESMRIEEEIDRQEIQIEEECLKLLALYQPVAGDLRFVTAVLKINNDLERMGDLGRHIAERALVLADHREVRLPVDLRNMAAACQRMVRMSLDAVVNQDAEVAMQVIHADNEMDEYHQDMFPIIAAKMRTNPEMIEVLLHVLSASRHLERISDYATNVAEDVVYLVRGEIIRHRED
jgi:phosphate transport system protein